MKIRVFNMTLLKMICRFSHDRLWEC